MGIGITQWGEIDVNLANRFEAVLVIKRKAGRRGNEKYGKVVNFRESDGPLEKAGSQSLATVDRMCHEGGKLLSPKILVSWRATR